MVWKMNSSIDWHKVAVYLFAITCPEVMNPNDENINFIKLWRHFSLFLALVLKL